MSFTACPLCGGTKFGKKYQIDEHKIMQCRSCEMMWLTPQPSIDELHSVYDDNYFNNPHFLEGNTQYIYGYTDYAAERFNKQSSYVPIAERTHALISQDVKDPRLLDVGCGLGYFLDVAHDEGFRVSGVEFNGAALEQLRRKYVFPTYCGDFIEFQDEPFHVITMFDVIEHLLDPFAAIEKANRLLHDQGILLLSTMDCGSLVSRILGTRVEDFRRVREHLYFFTRAAARTLLQRHGFEVLEIRFHGHTFCLDMLAHRMKLSFPLVGGAFDTFVHATKIGRFQVHLNPMTKMLITARKVREVA